MVKKINRKGEGQVCYEYVDYLVDGDGTKEIRRRLTTTSMQLVDMGKQRKTTNNKRKFIIIRTRTFPAASYGCEHVV